MGEYKNFVNDIGLASWFNTSMFKYRLPRKKKKALKSNRFKIPFSNNIMIYTANVLDRIMEIRKVKMEKDKRALHISGE